MRTIKNHKWICMVLVFLTAFIPRVIWVQWALPIRTISDEVSTLNSAAMAAGYDWSSVVSNAGYYGYGFYFLCAPLFRLMDDPVMIYRGILVITSLTQACTSLICFYICDRFMDLNGNYHLISLISVTASYAVVTKSTVVFNEHPLILLSWLAALLICKYLETKKVRFLLLLYIIMGYALTVHTRAVLLLAVVTGFLLIYSAVNKKKMRILVIIIIGMIVYAAAHVLGNWYKESIWLTSEGIRNANVSIKINGVSFNADTLKAWLSIILGQIQTLNVFLFGTVFLLFNAIIKEITHMVKTGSIKTNGSDKMLMGLSVIFVVCIAGTIFAQSLSWLKNVVSGFQQDSYTAYGYKAFTYIRYFGPYIGPVVMCGLVSLVRQKDNIKQNLNITLLMNILLCFYWFCSIMPYIQENNATTEVFWSFAGMKVGISPDYDIIAKAFMISFGLFIFCMILLRKKRDMLFMAFMAAVLIYQYCYQVYEYDLGYQKKYFTKISETYEYISNLKYQVNEDYFDIIYVYDGRDITDHQTYFQYQFYFFDSSIQIGIPGAGFSGFLLSNIEVKDQLEDFEYELVKLDDDEYVYILGGKLIEQIK